MRIPEGDTIAEHYCLRCGESIHWCDCPADEDDDDE